MILDSIENIDFYRNLHPNFPKVFNYLKSVDLQSLSVGRHQIDNDFYINIDESELRPLEHAKPEVHQKYIDIQIPLSRSEQMGYIPLKNCKNLYENHQERDIAFYNNRPTSIFEVSPQEFAIFFPQDAHAPIIGQGSIRKAIVKVKL